MNGLSANGSAPARGVTVVCLLLLIVVGFFLRLAPLGRYVTPDEPNWVYRSIRFGDAVAAGNWSEVPSTGHPGVTTMWLGSTAVRLQGWLSPHESGHHLEWIRRLAWLDPEIGAPFSHLAFFLPGGRIAVALVSALALAALLPLLSHLFDRTVALLTIGLLAFDPFLVGHSGLLHTDALLATFTMLTLVTALNGFRHPHQVAWWPAAGVGAALALLTKSPATIAVGFVGLLLLWRWLDSVVRGSAAGSWLRPLLHGVLFAACLLITLAALHPGLWADPVGVLQEVFYVADRHLTSVQHPIYFAGQVVLDPGPLFYPAVLLFRVSPVVLIGLAWGLFRLFRLPPERRGLFLLLTAFAVLYGLVISLSTKKHGRYLLPMFPPLALAAAVGWDALVTQYGDPLLRWIGSHVKRPAGLPGRQLLGGMVILLQATIALTAASYPLNHFNPLLGGAAVASRFVPTGWGEGWGAAARLLNRLPEAESLTVAVGSVPPFAAVFDGQTLPLNEATIHLADYVVSDGTDETPVQLRVVESVPLPSGQRPTIFYENMAPREQADWLAARVEPDDLIVADADTPLLRTYSGPGEIFSVGELPDEVAIAEWLCEHLPGREGVWLVASPGASPITTEHLARQLERMATPVGTSVVAASTITRFALDPTCPAAGPERHRAGFGADVALVDGVVPESVEWRQPIEVTLRWQTLRDGGPDYRAVVRLRSADGQGWAGDEWPVHNGANVLTSAWTAGEWADVTYQLPLPAGIPPDRYTVEVSLYDAGTGVRLGALGSDGSFQGTRMRVGSVEIQPSPDPPTAEELDIGERLDVSARSLRLIGMNPVVEAVLSGDLLSLELFWQAEGIPEADYRVRWRLRGPQDDVGVELDSPLSPYRTSQWSRGDRLRVHYQLPVSPSLPPGEWQVMLNVLDEEGDPLWDQDRALAVVGVLYRERGFTLPDDIPHPMGVRFGDGIHLRGYELPRSTVGSGESLPLTLYWEAEGPTERSYTLFVHLVGPDDQLAGQIDRIPGGGAAPTTTWAAGQAIVEDVSLPVAHDVQAGAYGIAVGFYDAAYGGRLPLVDADGQILDQDQVILPTRITVTH